MRVLLFVTAIIALAAIAQAVPIAVGSAADATLWGEFKSTYGRIYPSVDLENYRFSIFQSNLRKAELLNKKAGKVNFGVTKFSDLDPVEFKRQYLTYRPPFGEDAVEKRHWAVKEATRATTPPTSDWRKKNAVTAVKDQGQCGSCWAFSVTETMESFWFLTGNPLLELSPQQVTDCDTNDSGCNGGDTVVAYQYLATTGLEKDSSYPYTSGGTGNTGTCQYISADVVTNPLKNFTYATPPCQDACTSQDENTLAVNIAATGPASICVAADVWQSYTGGILSSDCSSNYSDLDHCVQVVGLETKGSDTYWLVRNSWNTDWGEQGYIWIKYGDNLCGIADEATFIQF